MNCVRVLGSLAVLLLVSAVQATNPDEPNKVENAILSGTDIESVSDDNVVDSDSDDNVGIIEIEAEAVRDIEIALVLANHRVEDIDSDDESTDAPIMYSDFLYIFMVLAVVATFFYSTQ